MWPWGHFGVAYFCYVASLRVRTDEDQTLAPLLAVGFGSQFPDLMDKPLAWSLTILPSGRSFAHSFLTAAVVIGVCWAVGRRVGHEESVLAFAIGYIAHSLTDLGPDVIFGLVQGDMSQLTWTTYLLWPILSAPPYPNDSSFAEHFIGLALDPYMVFQFVLFGVAIVIWVLSGMPGVSEIRLRLQSRPDRDLTES